MFSKPFHKGRDNPAALPGWGDFFDFLEKTWISWDLPD
jgi:hypothetical protein